MPPLRSPKRCPWRIRLWPLKRCPWRRLCRHYDGRNEVQGESFYGFRNDGRNDVRGKPFFGLRSDGRNDGRGKPFFGGIENDKRRTSKRRNEKKEKEKTKTFQQRKSFKTSINDFLIFTNLFPKKKKRKKRKKGLGVLSESMDVMP